MPPRRASRDTNDLHNPPTNGGVADAIAKFTSLSRYAPHLVDTENRKARRFEKGLRRGIKNRLLALKLPTYAKVVERAEILEADYEEFQKEKEEQRQKRGRTETSDKNKVYATIVDPKKAALEGLGPLLTGLVVGANIMAGGAFSGAAMNPARAFGPALISGDWTDHWVYWVGPLIGGGLAGFMFENFFIVRTHVPIPSEEDGF
ncbi:hypothetical protein RJ639_039295 [Escallonia herrerae]|uniref:Aquaporin n=1 Tax=Escallonia herrerae TaxID=1293975 RepID=A0AA88WNV9_9ASTE|nr:hypothetical protein RJ639_039295 [Escallonia herrerae]